MHRVCSVWQIQDVLRVVTQRTLVLPLLSLISTSRLGVPVGPISPLPFFTFVTCRTAQETTSVQNVTPPYRYPALLTRVGGVTRLLRMTNTFLRCNMFSAAARCVLGAPFRISGPAHCTYPITNPPQFKWFKLL